MKRGRLELHGAEKLGEFEVPVRAHAGSYTLCCLHSSFSHSAGVVAQFPHVRITASHSDGCPRSKSSMQLLGTAAS